MTAKLGNPIFESRNSAILDSGATNTVTGKSQMTNYIDSLQEAEKVKFRCRESKNSYCFGDDNRVLAIKILTFLPLLVIKEKHST